MMFTDLHIMRPCYVLCEYLVVIVQYAGLPIKIDVIIMKM